MNRFRQLLREIMAGRTCDNPFQFLCDKIFDEVRLRIREQHRATDDGMPEHLNG